MTIAQLIAANPEATDAEIVALYKEANKQARSSDLSAYVTYTTLAKIWGAERAGQLAGELTAAGAQGSATALLADKVLSGRGFDAQDADSIATMAGFVQAGLCTQAEADLVRWTYPALTEAEVAAERGPLPRRLAKAALKSEATSLHFAINTAVDGIGDGEIPTFSALVSSLLA